MPLVLCRIDDRLIHGQVVVGWGQPLKIDIIVLVDDEVAGSQFEKELYRMALPARITVEFLTVTEAPGRLAELSLKSDRVLVLTGSVAAMATLARSRPGLIQAVNVGGLHAGPGRQEYLRYVYATESERETLMSLERDGVRVTAQDLPDVRPIPVSAWKAA